MFPVHQEPPVLEVVVIASFPGTGHHCKEPRSILFAPFLKVFVCIGKISLSLLWAATLGLSSYERYFRLLIILVALCWTLSTISTSLLYWRPRTGVRTVAPPVLSRGEPCSLTCNYFQSTLSAHSVFIISIVTQ